VSADRLIEQVRTGYVRVHAQLLEALEKTAAEHVQRPIGNANSIAFNVWHVARWDDFLIPGLIKRTPPLGTRLGDVEQIWVREDLGRDWGMPETLGAQQAGTGLPSDDARGLLLPDRAVLGEYAGRVFRALDAHLARLDEEMFDLEVDVNDQERPRVSEVVLYYWEHAARHLGMIEAVRGALGEVGSARA
jgi:hypothetical protein